MTRLALLLLVPSCLLALAGGASATPTVTPRCAAPKAGVKYRDTVTKAAPTRARALLLPQYYETPSRQTSPNIPATQVAEGALTDAPGPDPFLTYSVIDLTWAMPTATQVQGHAIEGYFIFIKLTDDAGTEFASPPTTAFVDLSAKLLIIVPKVQIRFGQIFQRTSGFGTASLFAHIVDAKGKRLRTSPLGRSRTTTLPCGTNFTTIPPLDAKFKPGNYRVVVNTSSTNPRASGSVSQPLKATK